MTKTEEQIFAEIADHLSAKYSDVSSTRVAAVINDTRNLFSDSKIRDFIPLLVERRASRELSTTTA